MKKLSKSVEQKSQASLYSVECVCYSVDERGLYESPTSNYPPTGFFVDPKNIYAIDVYGKSAAERISMINGAIQVAHAMGGYTEVVVYSRTSLVASYNIEAVYKSGKIIR